MNDPQTATGRTLAELRSAFDGTFAALPRGELDATESFIAVRIGKDAYALRVRDLGHLSGRHKIVPLPGGPPELLGLAGIRETITPVYSLARMLGYDAADRTPRWLVTSGEHSEMALAFEAFEGCFRVPAAELGRADGKATAMKHAREVVASGGELAAVIDVASVMAALMNTPPVGGRP